MLPPTSLQHRFQMPKHPRPEPNFDRVARLYRWAEYLTLGPLLQQTRTALLDRLSGCRQALLLGDGDGRFLAQLLRRYPDMQATAVDTSAAMLRLLQARARSTTQTTGTRLNTLHASALDVDIPPATDLVVTHFFLDCLSQADVDRLAAKVAAATQPGALWLVSDFAIPAHPLLRPAARVYIRALYLAFRRLTGLRVQHLPDPQAALTSSGFRLLASHRSLGGLLYSELWVLEHSASQPRHNPGVPGFIHTPMQASDQLRHSSSSPEKGGRANPSQQYRLSSRPAAAPLQPQWRDPRIPNQQAVRLEENSSEPYPDAQPDPEPAVPSLPEPDPGVFHHDPGPVPSTKPQA